MTASSQHKAFLKDYTQCIDPLRAFLFAALRDWARTDDMLQEVALVLWEKFETFDRQHSFKAWSIGIASNHLRRHYRALKQQEIVCSLEVLDVLEARAKQQEHQNHEQIEALHHCIRTLPQQSQRLLKQRYEAGLSLDELALKLGKSLASITKGISRLRFQLKLCVSKQLETR